MKTETSGHPYRSVPENIYQRFNKRVSIHHAIIAGALIGLIVTVWFGRAIQANLIAASRPGRILVRIPTPVPGPVRVVERVCPPTPVCPQTPECVESARSIAMESYTQSDVERCHGNGIMHTTIRDHFLVVECHCPPTPPAPVGIHQ